MKRELKFRAYLKQEKEMREVFSFCDKFIKVIVGMGTAWELDINEFEPIMQFTGLKDKNGVDIYEADIVKFQQDYIKPKAVYWNDEMTGFYPLISERSIRLEVIGNIHENPELLSTK